jgi:hypothetical protein
LQDFACIRSGTGTGTGTGTGAFSSLGANNLNIKASNNAGGRNIKIITTKGNETYQKVMLTYEIFSLQNKYKQKRYPKSKNFMLSRIAKPL